MLRRLLAIILLLLAALGVAAAQPLDGLTSHEAAHVQIAVLIQQSSALGLPARVERAFMLTLHAANDACRDGDIPKTVMLLRTFAYEVSGVKRARRVPVHTADGLIARAELAIGTLSRPR